MEDRSSRRVHIDVVQGPQLHEVCSGAGGGITIIFLCGLFGWSSTPAAFQVTTRAIVFELGQILLGVSLMYVDDIVGLSKRKELKHDGRREVSVHWIIR